MTPGARERSGRGSLAVRAVLGTAALGPGFLFRRRRRTATSDDDSEDDDEQKDFSFHIYSSAYWYR